MFRDPEHRGTNPYELLDLRPDASLTQVNRALPRFLLNPNNRGRVAEAQKALQQLRNPRQRAVIDVLHYEWDAAQGIAQEQLEQRWSLEEFRCVPRLEPEAFPSDLEAGLFDAQPPKLVFQAMEITEIRKYGQLEAGWWKPEFDR